MPGRRGLADTDDDIEPISRAPPTRPREDPGKAKGRSHVHFIPHSAAVHREESEDNDVMDKKLPPVPKPAGYRKSPAKFIPDSPIPPGKPDRATTMPDADIEAKRAAARSPAVASGAAARQTVAANDTTQSKGTLDRYLHQSSAAHSKRATSASAATPRVSNVSPKLRRKEDHEDEAEIGAIAVPGPDSGNSIDGTIMYSQSVGRKPEPIEEEVPLEATLVTESAVDEADVEAQVQERMRYEASDLADMIQERIFQKTVLAEVQPEQATTASTAGREQEIEPCNRRNRCILLVLAVLVIAGAVGAGVGVALSKSSSSTTTDPTATPPTTPTPPTTTPADEAEVCSLCYDGSTPSGLDTNTVGDQTCAEYREDVIKLVLDMGFV